MNARTLIVGTLAVVCGLSAMVLVQALRKPSSGPVVEKAPVVFMAADIKPGEMIQEAMVEVREIPKTEIPEDAIIKPLDAIDRAAMTQLDKGDMLRQKKLAEKGAGRGMAALIKTGMRAFTIQTPTLSSSMAGFVLPHDKVDILLTVTSQGGNEDEAGGSTTTTLLQNVEILANHTTTNMPTNNRVDPDQARSVTVLVTPEEASLLDLGQSKGTLHLSLRNLKDTTGTKPKPTTVADLNLPRTVKPAPPAPPQVVVEKPVPPPTPEQLPAFEPIVPETEEVKLTVRTLRGTGAGQDIVTMIRPVSPSKGNGRSPSSNPTGIARTASTESSGKVSSLAGTAPLP